MRGIIAWPRLRAQFIKEVLSILRDPRSRMVVFVPPIFQLLVFAFAATLEVRNIELAVYNQDHGRWSVEYLQQLHGAGFVSRIHQAQSQQHLGQMLERGEVIAALSFPADFSRAISAGEPASVQVLVDGRRSNAGQISLAYLNRIAASVNAQTQHELSVPEPAAVRHLFNPNLIYRWFTVPGLTGILALFSALLITSLSIAREREMGTFDQLLVSPTTTTEIILAKSLPALLIGTLLGLVMIAAGVFLFGIPFTGSFGWLLLSLILFILSVVGIGLMLSAISMTQQQAILAAFAVGIPAVLMSGFATPVENMPQVLQWLAQLIPLTHFLIIVEGSFLKGLPTRDVLHSLWPLACIAATCLGAAVWLVRGRLQ